MHIIILKLYPSCTVAGRRAWRPQAQDKSSLQSWENIFKTTMEICIPKGVLPTIPSMQQSDGTCADNKLDNVNMLNNYFSNASLPHCHPYMAPLSLLNRGGGYISVFYNQQMFLKQVALTNANFW